MPLPLEQKNILNDSSGNRNLQGSLSLTTVSDLLQFLAGSGKRGGVKIVRPKGGEEGTIYFGTGKVLSAESGGRTGLECFAYLLSWKEGTFQFLPGVIPMDTTIGLPVQHAILEAVVLQENMTDPNASNSGHESEEGNMNMEQEPRDSTEIMSDLLEISGIDAVVVVGRDGFVIESAGSSARVNIDELGGALAHAINSMEEMGTELNISSFQDMFIEYGRAVLLCKPVGDAVAAVITPDASKLGIIRHKTKKLFHELSLSF
jgi:predicted regulator of Ras-like GTPase activity (Roadblock/LC7/MglB family)